MDMIEGEFRFIIHAPWQSGKTAFIQLFTNEINFSGRFSVYFLGWLYAALAGAFSSVFFATETKERLALPGRKRPGKAARFIKL